jgi:hypothetical protein
LLISRRENSTLIEELTMPGAQKRARLTDLALDVPVLSTPAPKFILLKENIFERTVFY